MMTTSKPPTGLPGSLTIHLPAFKRKRIEQWCEDVAQYLKAGSLCRSVIGHVIEDNRLQGPAVKSAPAGIQQRTNPTTNTINPAPTTTTTNNNTTGITTSSMGTMAEMLVINTKKDGGGVGNNNNNNNNNNNSAGLNGTKNDSAPPPGRGTPMPDTSGPLPVVKFSYSHYNEQRRRIDRLVQGLPVLTSPGTPNSSLDRLAGNNGAIVYVSGEEPVKPSGFGTPNSKPDKTVRTPGRASPTPGPDARCNSRSSSGEPRQRSSLPTHMSRHRSISPSPTRGKKHHHHHTSSSQPHHGILHASNNKIPSSEIVVIEDEIHGHNHHNGFAPAGLRSMKLNGLKRSQSLKVHRARQKMLANTRRSGDQNTHTHVPVQSCWALAELTW